MGAYDNIVGFGNGTHQWLTYETLFNHLLYRRSNQRRDLGTYRIPLDATRIIVGKDVPQPLLDQLCDAFFPDLVDTAQLLRYAERPWGPGHDAARVRKAKADAHAHVVMPYNIRDNDWDSPAIGTASRTRHRAELLPGDPPRVELSRLAATWPMWSTASRSCVVRVGRVKARGAAWQDETAAFDSDGVLEGRVFNWPVGLGGQYEAADHTGPDSLAVATLDGCFSLKSGVMYVGGSTQGGASAGGKATLEENSILACLRSDYIADVDRSVGHDPVGDPVLLVLPEILTVTEDLGARPGDGFQVRDLSRLRRDRVYFPALSIPYVDVGAGGVAVGFDTLSQRWSGRDDDGWAAFWGEHYAARLGVVKATLLMRYGLQLSTPNSQNFLIELDTAMHPTGRIVVRDVGDAMLHTEAIWALFGKASAVPATLKNVAGLRDPALDYECTTLVAHGNYYPSETGGDHGNSFDYPAGTQFHWHFYSSLGKGGSVYAQSNNSTDPDARAAGWRHVLHRNAAWGLAHNRAYVACLETVLGVPTIPIDWAATPDAARYLAIADDDQQYKRADELWREDVAAERAQAAVVHGVLAAADGQAALRRYHERRWVPAAFTMRVVDGAGKPVVGSAVSHRRIGVATPAASTRTDADGRLRLPGHPAHYRFQFEDYQNSVLRGWLTDLKVGRQLDFDFVKIDIQPA